MTANTVTCTEGPRNEGYQCIKSKLKTIFFFKKRVKERPVNQHIFYARHNATPETFKPV